MTGMVVGRGVVRVMEGVMRRVMRRVMRIVRIMMGMRIIMMRDVVMMVTPLLPRMLIVAGILQLLIVRLFVVLKRPWIIGRRNVLRGSKLSRCLRLVLLRRR